MKNLVSTFGRTSILVLAVASAACGSSTSDDLVGAGAPRRSARGSDTGGGAAATGEAKADTSETAPPGVPFTGTIDEPATYTPTAPPVFREVWGMPTWLCADLGEVLPSKSLVSSWYQSSAQMTSAVLYVGTCASLSGDPDKAKYDVVPGWPEYKCATLPDGNSSMWFLLGNGVRTAVRVAGSCASWARTTGY